jgi:hypothetical protein
MGKSQQFCAGRGEHETLHEAIRAQLLAISDDIVPHRFFDARCRSPSMA